MKRLGIVVSHPIQYQVPLYQLLTKRGKVDLRVYYLTDHGVNDSYDPGFGQAFKYDIPLLEGYSFEFVKNVSPKPSPSTFLGSINPNLIRIIKKSSLDCVLVHGWSSMSSWIVLTTARSSGIPYFIRGEARPDTQHVSPLKLKVKHALIKPLVRSASACLSIGEENKKFYLEYGASLSRIYDAPYSIDTERFGIAGEKGRANRSSLLSGIGLNSDRFTLLFAAKFQEWKRPLDVVRAVDKLGGKINLVMIGDGPLYRIAKEMESSRPWLKLLGFVNQSEIGEWYGASDVFVLPSDNEPWGLAVNEAVAAGAVPIVSDSVGCANDLKSFGLGWVFETANIDSLAQTIDRAYIAKDLDVQKEALVKFSKAFGVEATATGIESAVEDFVK